MAAALPKGDLVSEGAVECDRWAGTAGGGDGVTDQGAARLSSHMRDPAGLAAPTFSRFGQNALAAYCLHHYLAHFQKLFVPDDSPGWWCLLHLCLSLYARPLPQRRPPKATSHQVLHF